MIPTFSSCHTNDQNEELYEPDVEGIEYIINKLRGLAEANLSITNVKCMYFYLSPFLSHFIAPSKKKLSSNN